MNIIRIDNMTIAKIRLGDVRHNPFRRFEEFPLIEKKVVALQNSIRETGFWDNVLGRVVDNGVEIAYGHHRIEAARREYGDDHEIGVTIRELSDIEMLRVMGLENSEDWMNPVQHAHLVVRQARAFFDSWFEKFPTWYDFRQSLENKQLDEFGASWDVSQIERWFGGSDTPNNWEKSIKYGVGHSIIQRFVSGLTDDAVSKTLRILGPSDREKVMLSKMEEERRQADELLAKQREAEVQAKREQEEADLQAKAAEDARRKQAAIARNVADESKKKAAQEEADKQAKLREEAKRERDAADKRAKAAEKAQRDAEKKAKEANQAEQQKRKAAEEQQNYDQSATFLWEKHDHAAEFRRLCLSPLGRELLVKEKQTEFATYLKEIISGEVTSDKIRQYFEAELRNFIAGIRKQKEEENPILRLNRKLESLHDKAVSVSKACHDVMNESKRLGVVGINGIGAYDLKESLEAMLQTLSGFYSTFHLRSDYLAKSQSDAKSLVTMESL